MHSDFELHNLFQKYIMTASLVLEITVTDRSGAKRCNESTHSERRPEKNLHLLSAVNVAWLSEKIKIRLSFLDVE